ncbi:MAG TPA: glycosyltransferase family 4 protein [Puia sp.]|jgi:glycosyltransferase involved in cell wall biosynthesis|nr:glycosyltransferase family 4 protein [Puia sp.]
MKIAVISMIREPWGGSEELWFAMAKQAIAEGHTVMHMSFDFDTVHPRLVELRDMGALLFRRPGYFPPGLSPRARAVRTLVNFLKKKLRNPFVPLFRHNPDVVVYNGTCYSIATEQQMLQTMGNRPRLYIIGHLNAENDRGFSSAARDTILSVYDRAALVFFISLRSLATARRHLCRDIPNAALIRNPVNMPDVTPLPFPSTGKVHWALVGNLIVAHKGQDILLAALADPRWMERDWILNIYGDGPDKEYLQMLTAWYQMQDKVIFHGKVSDIRQVWEHNQVLLMPSHMEGMPLAIVEAMLCGRPCMATDVGGAAEWIEDGVSGWLAPSAAVSSLDKALERVWQEKKHWASMGMHAHRKAMELYDPAAGKTLLDKLINL